MLWLLTHYQLLFVSVFLLLLLAGQLAELIHFVNRTNRELQKFIDALRYGDYSVSFAHARLGASFKGLEQSFTAIIETLKSSKAALNTQAELMKLALENIQMGLIIVNDLGQIELMNVAARKMLNLPHFKEWSMVQKKRPHFTSQLGDLQFEGRRLVEMNTPAEPVSFLSTSIISACSTSIII
ncbi:MAG: hypothetical protein U5L96_16485 [Owenweeksia sp.]|nr:hypothetical protein [Owenweeksia sp.]